MKNNTKVNDLFAFWRYDLFPYVLGAEVVSMTPKGNVEPKGYGHYFFHPIKLLPTEAGRDLWKQIEKIKVEYDKEMRALHETYKAKIHALLPEAKR